MSVQATTWVWEHSKAEGTTLLIALALADAANAQGERSCQSVATMAKMARTGERTVQRALRALEASGEIAPTGKDSRYKTTIYAFPALAARGDMAAAMGDTDEGPGVTSVTPRGDTAMSPNPKVPTPVTTPQVDPDAAKAAPSPHREKAAEIVRWWWEGLEIKPAGRGAYWSAVASVEAVLKVGHEAKAVAKALCSTGTPVSIPRLEIELARSRPKAGAQPGGSIQPNEAHYESGGGFWTGGEGPR